MHKPYRPAGAGQPNLVADRPPASLKAALWALDAGLWPVAIHPVDSKATPSPGKAPIGNSWGTTRPTAESLKATFKRHPKAGVGLKLGPQGGVIDLDVDDPAQAAPILARLFPDGLPATKGWSNAGGKFHLLFKWDDRLARYGKTIIKGQLGDDGKVVGNPHYLGLELRLNVEDKQVQTVIPPSQLANRAARKWNGNEEILPLPESVFQDLDAHALTPAAPPPKPAPKAVSNGADPLARARAYLAKIDPAISGHRGHDQCFKAACKMVEFGLDSGTTLRLLTEEYNPRCVPPWSDKELRHKVDEAYKENGDRSGAKLAEPRPEPRRRNGHASHPPAVASSGHPDAGDARPEIEVTTQRHLVVEEAIRALADDPDLYCRAGQLVVVANEPGSMATLHGGVEMRNAQGSPRIIALAEAVVGCYLTKNATFYQVKPDKAGELQATDCHPPNWLIRAVTDRGHWAGIRPLLAIAECPYIRPDGSIVQTPGYDPATGTLYRPAMEFPPVPEAPTRADAEAAAARLLAPVRQFPFASDDDRIVYLAAMLTGAARPSIPGPVPGIVFNGNKPACGKGLLIDSIGIIVWGNNVPTSCYPGDPAEAQKVKVAIAMAGKPAVHFDNLEEGRSYGNPALDSALTSTEIDDRVLGTSKTTGRLPLRVTWFLSGNNISPGKDAYRRWLPCNLITSLERPEERDDIEVVDLRAYMSVHRRGMVRDVLMILKAHADAGYPTGKWSPLGSFEQWDRIVRGAVWFATSRDCCATRRKAADESPARLAKIALLEGWMELPGGTTSGVTAAKAVEEVEKEPTAYATLRNAMLHFGREGKPATARTLGNLLRGMKSNVIDGLVFAEAGTEHKIVKWKVEQVGPRDQGGSGGSGGSALHPERTGPDTDYEMSAQAMNQNELGFGSRETHQTHQTHQDSDGDGIDWSKF